MLQPPLPSSGVKGSIVDLGLGREVSMERVVAVVAIVCASDTPVRYLIAALPENPFGM